MSRNRNTIFQFGRTFFILLTLLFIYATGSSSAASNSGNAALSVVTEPEKAWVKLNGKTVGVSPVNIPSLPPGEYSLLIKKKGFHPIRRKISLTPDKETNLSFTLKDTSTKGKGFLTITISPPSAHIHFRSMDTTYKDKMELDEGFYELIATARGFQTKKFTVEVMANANNKMHINLLPKTEKIPVRVLSGDNDSDQGTAVTYCSNVFPDRIGYLKDVSLFIETVDCFTHSKDNSIQANPGSLFFAILLKVHNNSDYPIGTGGEDHRYTYRLQTVNGTTYQAVNTAYPNWQNNRNVWDAERIEPGESHSGWIVFSVPDTDFPDNLLFFIDRVLSEHSVTSLGTLTINLKKSD